MSARRANITEPVDVEKKESEDKPEVEEQKTPDEPEVEDKPADPEPEPDDEVEDNIVAPEDWFPGRPCRNCGQVGYRWTVGWGDGCDLCLIEHDED